MKSFLITLNLNSMMNTNILVCRTQFRLSFVVVIKLDSKFLRRSQIPT